MRNPNTCRYIMFALVIIGLMIVGISGVLYGVDPIHQLFVVGSLISIGTIIFGKVLIVVKK